MDVVSKQLCTQSYQVVLYARALHPELFDLRSRKVVHHGRYELESWLMPGNHVLRFELGDTCASELVIDREDNLPSTGVVSAFPCAGEKDFEHSFETGKVKYLSTVQTEMLSENLYLSTYREMKDHIRENESQTFSWDSEAGPNLSVLDVQAMHNEVHIQAYHLVAQGGFVLRTASIFEYQGD
ncbi:MAG: hypothetical protein Phyf2KO_10520 [Phycisphaerales bacterium]